MEIKSRGFVWRAVIVFVLTFGTIKTVLGVETCNTGWTKCLSTGKCVPTQCMDIDSTDVTCLTNKIFCSAVGGCVNACPPVSAASHVSSPDMHVKCPHSEVYCMGLKMCVTGDECMRGFRKPDVPPCPLGLSYCLEKGGCVLGGCQDAPKRTSLTTCPLGTVLCLSLGRCVPERLCTDGGTADPQRPSYTQCPPGKVFCLASGSCEFPGVCEGDGSSPGGKGPGASTGELCSAGQVFCLASGKCEVGKCNTNRLSTICPRGFVYCFEKGDCVSPLKGCSESGQRERICPPGTMLSLDTEACVPDYGDGTFINDVLPDFTCPAAKEEAVIQGSPFTHTTCIINNRAHCPLNHSCCPDPNTLHQQCINSEGVPDPSTINMACQALNDDRYNTNIPCQVPQDCPIVSVCCNGICRSPSCPPETQYCELEKRCVKAGESCEKPCPPRKVLCVKEKDCLLKDDCKGEFTPGAPWMRRTITVAADGSSNADSEGTLISDSFPSANLIEEDQKPVEFKVLSIQNEYGDWQSSNNRELWMMVNVNDTLKSSQYLRYMTRSDSDSGFAVEYIRLNETGIAVNRTITQLLAPEYPEYEIKPRMTSITFDEDKPPRVISLAQIFNISSKDESYWEHWTKGLDLPKLAAMAKLIDTSHAYTVPWIYMLSTPKIQSGPNVGASNRGVKLALDDSVANLIDIIFSIDGGENWKRMTQSQGMEIPVSSLDSFRNVYIRIIPRKDAHGKGTLHFSTYTKTETVKKTAALQDGDAGEGTSGGYEIVVEVLPVNDAPKPIIGVDISRIPTVQQGKEEGEKANEYANIFFEDTEGDRMGIVVLQAFGGDLGSWQYSVLGSDYMEFENLSESPFPEDITVSAMHQGHINIKKEREKNQCNPKTFAENPGLWEASPVNANEDVKCLDELKKRFQRMSARRSVSNPIKLEGRRKREAQRSGIRRNIRNRRSARLRRQANGVQAQSTGIGTYSVAPFRSVNACYLPPDALIRFSPKTENEVWGKLEAFSNTKLVFQAWDASDEEVLPIRSVYKNVTVTACGPGANCGGSTSLSSDLAVLSAQWSDCSEMPILSGKLNEMDICGVCGGDNTTCIDCNEDFKGSAEIDCDGECTGGNTGKTSSRDCAGVCGNKNEINLDNGMCVPVEGVIANCDNATDSDAFINACGFCVRGTTGRELDFGINLCGECGTNTCVGCDGIPNSGTKLDKCGRCLSEADPAFNAPCKVIGNVRPNAVDIGAIRSAEGSEDLTEDVTLRAPLVGITKAAYRTENCSLVKNEGKAFVAEEASILRSDKVRAVFRKLDDAGKMTLECFFISKRSNENGTKEIVKVNSSEPVNIVDATKVEYESPSVTDIDTSVTKVLEITLKNVENLDRATGFLLYESSGGKDGGRQQGKREKRQTSETSEKSKIFVLELETKVSEDGVVSSTLPDNLRPGNPGFGVAPTRGTLEDIKSGKLDSMPIVPMTVQATAPKVITAILNPIGNTLKINFDQNVDSEMDCSEICAWQWATNERTPAPRCKFRASTLTVKPGPAIMLEDGMEIAFTDNNGIQNMYAEAGAGPFASGSFVITQPEILNPMDFELIGNSLVCNSSQVKFMATKIRPSLLNTVTVAWNITWEPKNTNDTEQADRLQIWDSITKIKNTMKTKATKMGHMLVFPSNLLIDGVEYLCVATLVTANGLSSEPQGKPVKLMPRDQTLEVSIRGPSKIYSTSKSRFIAVATPCSGEGPLRARKLKVFWDLTGKPGALANMENAKLKLRKGLLEGGRNYSLIGAAVSKKNISQRGEASLDITTVPAGIEAVLSTQSLTAGSATPFKISAAGSYDKDNKPGKINFRWYCELKDTGALCMLSENGENCRFENCQLETDKSDLKIQPGMFPPGKYTITLVASKDMSNATKTVDLEIVPGKRPYIYTMKKPMVVDATTKVIVKSLLTWEGDLTAWWECLDEPGYSFADISSLRSGQKIPLPGPSRQRPYDLVLPEGLLLGGTQYQCCLKVETDLVEQTGRSCVELKTSNPPGLGTYKVAPATGEALITDFTFTAYDWIDEDNPGQPLVLRYGYTNEDDIDLQNAIWFVTTTTEDPDLEHILCTESESAKIRPLIMVCNGDGSCTTDEGDLITLTIPERLPLEKALQLSKMFEEQIADDEQLPMIMDTFICYLSVLEKMNELEQYLALQTLIERELSDKMDYLTTRLENPSESEVDEVLTISTELLKGMMSFFDVNPPTTEMVGKVKEFSSVVQAKLTGSRRRTYIKDGFENTDGADPFVDDILFPATDKDLERKRGQPNLQNAGLKKGRKELQRMKRNTEEETQRSQTLNPLPATSVNSFLSGSEWPIKNKGPKNADKGDMEKLMDDIETYFSNMCLEMSYQSDPEDIIGDYTAVRVLKAYLDDAEKPLSEERLVIIDSSKHNNSFIKNDSFITWGPMLDNYTEWQCGRKGDEGEDVPCYGACLATAMFKFDFLGPVIGDPPPGEQRSFVVQAVLLNPETGVLIPMNEELKPPLNFSLVLTNDTVPAGYELKCFGWTEKQWKGRYCRTGEVYSNDGVSRISCLCSRTGYAVTMLRRIPDRTTTTSSTAIPEENTATPTTGTPVVFRVVKSVKFIIDADYDEVVGDEKEKFETHLTFECAKLLNTTPASIQNLTVSKGSIIVEFDLVEQINTRISGANTDELYNQLSEIISSGNLVLKGINNEPLNVPPQGLDGSGPRVEVKEDPTLLPIIIGSVVGGILLIVIVLICIAIYLKNKKRMDKVQPLQMTNTGVPTYSSIHFEKSLDGTASSLVKRRTGTNTPGSLTSGGAYSDEGIYIERRSTPASRGSTGSKDKDSLDSGTGQDVPDAFRYRSPTKEDMDKSQPIPEHIVQKMVIEQEEILPGTPGNLA